MWDIECSGLSTLCMYVATEHIIRVKSLKAFFVTADTFIILTIKAHYFFIIILGCTTASINLLGPQARVGAVQ